MRRSGAVAPPRRRRTTLLLVRHGESEDNVAGQWSGARDVPLTAAGRRQARRLGGYLAAAFPTHMVYSSPLSRAMETARSIGRQVGLEPIALDGLRERSLGRLEGRRRRSNRPRDIEAMIRRADGESGEAFRARVLNAIGEIARAHPGQTVAIVSHGGPLAVYLATVIGGSPMRWAEFAMDNAAVTIVSVDRQVATLHSFNQSVSTSSSGRAGPRPPARAGETARAGSHVRGG